jgi:hypothetical protein
MEPAAEFVTPPTPTFLISVSFTTETRGLRSVVSGRQALFLCGGGERIVTSMFFLHLPEEAPMITISKVVWIIDHTFPHSLLESAADDAGLSHFTNFHSASGNT